MHALPPEVDIASTDSQPVPWAWLPSRHISAAWQPTDSILSITCDLQATLLLHLVLWLWDKLPLGCILTSAAAQVAYLRMLRNFPFFRVFAPDTAAAVGALPRAHSCSQFNVALSGHIALASTCHLPAGVLALLKPILTGVSLSCCSCQLEHCAVGMVASAAPTCSRHAPIVLSALHAVLFLASNVVWWRWRFQHTWHSLEYVFGFYLMVVSPLSTAAPVPWPSC